MNFAQLNYFMRVAENCNFSVTAQKLYISQQALSAQIALLEKELNVRLFERSHPLRLTDAGKKLYYTSAQIIFMKDMLEQELHDMAGNQHRVLRIGIGSAHTRTLLPNLLADYYVRSPQVKIELHEAVFSGLSQLLLDHKVDLLLSRPLESSNVVSIPVLNEQILLFAPERTLAAVYGERLPEVLHSLRHSPHPNLDELRDCPIILPRNGNLRETCNRMFMQFQFMPNIRLETDFSETAIKLCERGHGITFAPESMLYGNFPQGGAPVDIYRLDSTIPWKPLSICRLENVYLSQAMESFIETCQDFFSVNRISFDLADE